MTLREYLQTPQDDALTSVCHFGPHGERYILSIKEAKKSKKVMDLHIDRIIKTKSGASIAWLY